MSILAQVVIVAIVFLMGAGTGWKAHVGITASRDLEAELTRQRDVLRKTEKIDTSAVQHELAKTRIESEFVEVTKEVIRVVKEPFYVDAPLCLDPDGVRLVNQAAGHATPSAGVASATVRQPPATD